jgi:hypothetical protein
MVDYGKALDNVWEKMDRLFFRGEFKPEQESDVQAFLYHGLLGRLRRHDIKPINLHTEQTFPGVGRVDLNVNYRPFIEIKLLSRKYSYKSNQWRSRVEILEEDARKLEKYVERTKSEKPEFLIRHPVLAIWNRKAGHHEGISEDLCKKLDKFKQRMGEQNIVVMYGPKKHR